MSGRDEGDEELWLRHLPEERFGFRYLRCLGRGLGGCHDVLPDDWAIAFLTSASSSGLLATFPTSGAREWSSSFPALSISSCSSAQGWYCYWFRDRRFFISLRAPSSGDGSRASFQFLASTRQPWSMSLPRRWACRPYLPRRPSRSVRSSMRARPT